MKLVTDTYHTDSRKSHACLDFALARNHGPHGHGWWTWTGVAGLDGLDWSAGNLPCLHLTSHSPHRGRRQTKKTSHGQEYERVYSVPELVGGV